MNVFIITIVAFTSIVLILCFAFCGYVLSLVLGGVKRDMNEAVDDTFTPLTEVASEDLQSYMRKKTGGDGFTQGKTLPFLRNEEVDDAPSEYETDPGETSVM